MPYGLRDRVRLRDAGCTSSFEQFSADDARARPGTSSCERFAADDARASVEPIGAAAMDVAVRAVHGGLPGRKLTGLRSAPALPGRKLTRLIILGSAAVQCVASLIALHPIQIIHTNHQSLFDLAVD